MCLLLGLHIRDTPAVAWQILEADKTVKMVHLDGCHLGGFGHTKIDCNAAAFIQAGL